MSNCQGKLARSRWKRLRQDKGGLSSKTHERKTGKGRNEEIGCYLNSQCIKALYLTFHSVLEFYQALTTQQWISKLDQEGGERKEVRESKETSRLFDFYYCQVQLFCVSHSSAESFWKGNWTMILFLSALCPRLRPATFALSLSLPSHWLSSTGARLWTVMDGAGREMSTFASKLWVCWQESPPEGGHDFKRDREYQFRSL